jgi:sulfur transfer protein SufE
MSEKNYFGQHLSDKRKNGQKSISHKIAKTAHSQALTLRKSQEARKIK